MPRQSPQSLAALLRTATKIDDCRAAELWTRYRATGDPATFNVLWLWIGRVVYPVLRGLLRDPTSAEDGVQGLLMSLVSDRTMMPAFTNASAARAWLRGAAVNVARQEYRAGGRRVGREQKATKSNAVAEDPEVRAVRDALFELSEAERDLIIRCHFARQTQEEAAAELDCCVKTLRKRLAAAEERLRKLLATLGVAVGAASGADALALPPGSSGIATDRLAEMLAGVWTTATPGWGTWAKTLLPTAAVLLGSGLAIGGWTLMRETQPTTQPQVDSAAKPPEQPRPVQVAPVELIEVRHRRQFEGVKQQLLTDLKPLAIGGGQPELRNLETSGTRLVIRVAIPQRPEGHEPFLSEISLSYDTNEPPGDEFRTSWRWSPEYPEREFDPRKPFVLFRDDFTGFELTARATPVEAALQTLRTAISRIGTGTAER